MIIKLIWRFLSALFHTSQGSIPDVNIGLSDQMPVTERHGYVMGKCIQTGERVRYDFLVDKPRFLFMPSKSAIGDLFKQLKKLGINANSIVVTKSNQPKIYTRAKYS